MQMTMQMSTSGVWEGSSEKTFRTYPKLAEKNERKKKKQPSILNYKVTMVAEGIYD